ncbi:MAG: hypothetical protein ACWGQW_24810 [bacterium]
MPNTNEDKRLQEFMDKMPKRTGANPVVCFFYLLMRDHLPVGVVTDLIGRSAGGRDITYTNGHLAQFAELCADELLKNTLR